MVFGTSNSLEVSFLGGGLGIHTSSSLEWTMANIEWMELFLAARSEYLRFKGSDHRPVNTHFDHNLKNKKGSSSTIENWAKNQKF